MSEKEDAVILPTRIVLPFSYSVGRIASKFFIELRDNKRIMGVKCPKCGQILVPPRRYCGKCMAETNEWVEVGDKGTLVAYTVTYRSSPNLPKKPPLAYGIIKLDGADTNMVHILGEVNLDKIKPGMRVQAVFKDQREGNILDIDYFKPI
ncbi:MAG: Zn-ribbon domain-containing OB-fold protein [Candidatus Freyarchaeota archaeon]|nr:Zn-ribbon domain-containing OB-fold protein [Candidatus Jordarchaeia archaeon]MBS7268874.1 Zn-ribbon domain-containing OB-fold protein [Candidatus Jordarchaeia archaeon]